MKSYDVAIIGLGTMGSFTALELARRHVSVAGLDQFAPPHHRGSHSGETRVFRMAYYEHPDYVPLAQRSGLLWDGLSQEFGTTLLTRSGMLSMGPEESEIIFGIRQSSRLHSLEVETLSASEIRSRFPAFQPQDDFVGLLEKTAGWIDADASIQYALKQAKDLGAELILDNPVLGWECRDNQLRLKTEREDLLARELIITAGAWANQVLRDLGLPLTVKRKVLAWFDPLQPEQFEEEKIPIFAFAPNLFYGFPNIGGRGVKVGEHLGGNLIHDLNVPVRPPSSEDLDSLVRAASEVVPTLIGPPPGRDVRLLRTMTCLYTLTPDEHFIIDQHPRHQNVFFAAGFSGHGFKFAPVIAEALADLALDGTTTLPIDFLRLKGRFEKSRN
jgi:sarcosine oxidase